MLTIDVVKYLMSILCGSHKKTEKEFYKFMEGQTISVVNNITFYYLEDVIRFLFNEQVVD